MTEQQKRAHLAAIVAADPVASKAKRRWETARRLLTVLTTLAMVSAVGLLIYLAGSANAGAEAIQDCTTPGGECYERSQRQSALLVGQIVKAQQVAVATGSAPARENLSLTRDTPRVARVAAQTLGLVGLVGGSGVIVTGTTVPGAGSGVGMVMA